MPDETSGFLTGVLDGWHAIPLSAMQFSAQTSDRAVTIAQACCGDLVRVAPTYGGYDRGDVPVTHHPCQPCAWTVAAATGHLDAEAARLGYDGKVATAMTRLLIDPDVAVKTARRIIAARGGDDGDGTPMIQLLAAVSEHAPVLLISEECSDGECDHDDGKPCTFQDAAAGCVACSLTSGSWAGEWEGSLRGECRIEAPCQVLTALALSALDMEAVTRLAAETLKRARRPA